MTTIECHDCKIPLDSDKAYFDPIKVDKWVRCLDCYKSILSGQRGETNETH